MIKSQEKEKSNLSFIFKQIFWHTSWIHKKIPRNKILSRCFGHMLLKLFQIWRKKENLSLKMNKVHVLYEWNRGSSRNINQTICVNCLIINNSNIFRFLFTAVLNEKFVIHVNRSTLGWSYWNVLMTFFLGSNKGVEKIKTSWFELSFSGKW